MEKEKLVSLKFTASWELNRRARNSREQSSFWLLSGESIDIHLGDRLVS